MKSPCPEELTLYPAALANRIQPCIGLVQGTPHSGVLGQDDTDVGALLVTGMRHPDGQPLAGVGMWVASSGLPPGFVAHPLSISVVKHALTVRTFCQLSFIVLDPLVELRPLLLDAGLMPLGEILHGLGNLRFELLLLKIGGSVGCHPLGRGRRPPDPKKPVADAKPQRRQEPAKDSAGSLTTGKLNAVRPAFKAGVKPSAIARQFGISQSNVRKALAQGQPREA